MSGLPMDVWEAAGARAIATGIELVAEMKQRKGR